MSAMRTAAFDYLGSDHSLAELGIALDQADKDEDVLNYALGRLGFFDFSRTSTAQYWNRQIEKKIMGMPAIAILATSLPIYVLSSLLYEDFKRFLFVFPFLGAIIAYQNWRRNRMNDTVNDALRRKDIANNYIVENAQVILPFVQNSLSTSKSFADYSSNPGKQIIIDMYIFNEIDNLEFVFEKSKNNLIDPYYAMRAIKIFIARNENPKFRVRAETLLEKGRYHHDFLSAASILINVAGQNEIRNSAYGSMSI